MWRASAVGLLALSLGCPASGTEVAAPSRVVATPIFPPPAPARPTVPAPPPPRAGTQRVEVSARGCASAAIGDRVDLIEVTPSQPDGSEPVATTRVQAAEVAAALDAKTPAAVLSVLVRPAEAAVLEAKKPSQAAGNWACSLRPRSDPGADEEIDPATNEVMKLGLRLLTLEKKRVVTSEGREPDVSAPLVSMRTLPGFRAVSLELNDTRGIQAGDHLDLVLTLSANGRPLLAFTLFQNVVVLDSSGPPDAVARVVSMELLPEEAAVAVLAARAGELRPTLRNPGDLNIRDDRKMITPKTIIDGELINGLLLKRIPRMSLIKGSSEVRSGTP